MKLRIRLAVWAGKLTRRLLRLFRRGGTALPGKAALFFCPTALEALSRGVETVVVTGTNGKTTTCGMLAEIFRSQGVTVLANRSGANLLSGITAEFAANTDWRGRPRCSTAVIECDEAALKQVTPLLRPRTVVVTNLFRDQLDRYGEVMHTLESVRAGIEKAPEATLCLNADCSLTASLGTDRANKVVYFGLDVPPPGADGAPEPSDAPRCLRCGAAYEYEYRCFGHLGGFYCPACGWRRPETDVAITAIFSLDPDSSAVEICAEGRRHPAVVGLPGAYNLYNAAAAVAGAAAMGIGAEASVPILAAAKSCFGRMESFRLGQVRVRMILVKNPTGCNQALSFLARLREPYLPVFCLNDRTADGRDVSWIWDADYERLNFDRFTQGVLVSGDRAEDMRLRLKYAGAEESAVRIVRENGELLRLLAGSPVPVYVLPTYTAMLSLRQAISRACGERDFWE
jgi:UDP-N-acetylmuramyl tripeptide synthase